jgi:N6-adenosine-specific RNA methylase IME4
MESGAKKYNIIYADPPWDYKVWGHKGKRGCAVNHYSTQTLEYLESLNIAPICETNCALFMWATFPLLGQALQLGQSWGFTYKTTAFVWIKKNRKNNLFFTGMGYYTRANAEIVRLFTRGQTLKRLAKDVGQVVFSKIGQHSVKPPEIRNRIVRLFGDLPRIELFARSRAGFFPDYEYKGWDVFGNEVNHSIEIQKTHSNTSKK